MTPVLHYAPDNASLCVRLALEASGLDYTTRLVDRRTRAQKSAAYLAINPMGLIPAMETPEGPLFETAAILLWINAQRPGVLMAPSGAARAEQTCWLIWLANTLHPALRMLFYPDQYLPDRSEDLRAALRGRITDMLGTLDTAERAAFLDADDLTLAGCYLVPMLRWCALYGGDTSWFDLSRYPRLARFAVRVEDTAAARTAAQAEGLGPRPFSAPVHADPPEGSAT